MYKHSVYNSVRSGADYTLIYTLFISCYQPRVQGCDSLFMIIISIITLLYLYLDYLCN